MNIPLIFILVFSFSFYAFWAVLIFAGDRIMGYGSKPSAPVELSSDEDAAEK